MFGDVEGVFLTSKLLSCEIGLPLPTLLASYSLSQSKVTMKLVVIRNKIVQTWRTRLNKRLAWQTLNSTYIHEEQRKWIYREQL
jgi:hypothetical protein